MKRFILAAAASAAAIVAAAPASAATYLRDLGTVTTPPDAFFSPSILVTPGVVDAYYTFTLTSAFTVNGANFTSTNPNAVSFNNVGVYAGTATNASMGTPAGTRYAFNNVQSIDPGGNSIGFVPVQLAAGSYTIYLSGNAATTNTVSSSIRFTAPVPEPATWGLMLLGFGMVGVGLRARRQSARVTFA